MLRFVHLHWLEGLGCAGYLSACGLLAAFPALWTGILERPPIRGRAAGLSVPSHFYDSTAVSLPLHPLSDAGSGSSSPVFFRAASYGKAHHHRNRRCNFAQRRSADSCGKNCITAKQFGGFGCFPFSAGKQRVPLFAGARLPPAVSCGKYGAVQLSAYGAFSGTTAFPSFFPPFSGLDCGMRPADCLLLSSISPSPPQLRLRRNASNLKGYTLWIYVLNIFQNASKT